MLCLKTNKTFLETRKYLSLRSSLILINKYNIRGSYTHLILLKCSHFFVGSAIFAALKILNYIIACLFVKIN